MNNSAYCWWASTILNGECRFEKLTTAGPATGCHIKEYCDGNESENYEDSGKEGRREEETAKAMKASSSSTKKSPAKKAGAKKARRV